MRRVYCGHSIEETCEHCVVLLSEAKPTMTREERIKQIEEHAKEQAEYDDENFSACEGVPFLLSEVKRLEAENAELSEANLSFFIDAANPEEMKEKIKSYQALQKENAELRAFTLNKQREMQSKLDKAFKALEKCKHLTFCWVIAEATVHCTHTYEDIRKVVTEALAEMKEKK